MVQNDFCLGGASKQNALVLENVPKEVAPMPRMSRIGPVQCFVYDISYQELWRIFFTDLTTSH